MLRSSRLRTDLALNATVSVDPNAETGLHGNRVEITLGPHHVAASLREEAAPTREAAVVLPVTVPQDCAKVAQNNKADPLAQNHLQQKENQLLKEESQFQAAAFIKTAALQWVKMEGMQELIKACSCQWAGLLALPLAAAPAGSALPSGHPRHLRHPATPTHTLPQE